MDMSGYDALLDNEPEAILRAADKMSNAGSEISRAIRNLDTTIKNANAAARDIKIAGMYISGAIIVLTVVQIFLQFG